MRVCRRHHALPSAPTIPWLRAYSTGQCHPTRPAQGSLCGVILRYNIRFESHIDRFTRLYETLPPEAQRTLVKKQLVALLDLVPKEKSKKAIAAATRLKHRYAGIPVLDLKAKEREINGILDELKRDHKTSLVKGRSNKDQLLEEAIQSLVDWMNDIWSVVYEHHVNFALAHLCLIFAAEALLELGNTRGG